MLARNVWHDIDEWDRLAEAGYEPQTQVHIMLVDPDRILFCVSIRIPFAGDELEPHEEAEIAACSFSVKRRHNRRDITDLVELYAKGCLAEDDRVTPDNLIEPIELRYKHIGWEPATHFLILDLPVAPTFEGVDK